MYPTEVHCIEVGGQHLRVRIAGVARTLPSVMLESGGGGPLVEAWSQLEHALAPHTRVLSYERAGIGAGAGPFGSVLPQAVAQRLERLLDATGHAGPVILAGHSLGGLYSRWFAATRPHRVAGLVLMDSTPEDMPRSRQFALVPALLWTLHGLARMKVLPLLAGRGLPQRQLAAISSRQHVQTVLAEIAALGDIQAEVAALPPAAPLPVLAISAGAQPTVAQSQHRERFDRSHERMAAAGEAPYSRHIRLAGATHMSMLANPHHAQAAAAEILAFARQIQARSSPHGSAS